MRLSGLDHMSKNTKRVKLQVYTHTEQRTDLDIVEAESWDKFVIARVKATTPAELENLRAQFNAFAEQTGKIFIMVPAELDIDFYGIKELDD